MESFIDLGDRSAPLTVRVNRRARRLIVRVDSVKGRVLVTAPSKRAIDDALRFAETRKTWIRRRLDEGAPAKPFEAGGVCPYQGVLHRIVNEGPARAPVFRIAGDDPEIFVGGTDIHLNRRLVDWLKAEARKRLVERVDIYAAMLSKKRGAITLRDTRSRWGSCSAKGDMSFSWRLILAPPSMLDYVAAHECAHLVRLDHSPAYWRIVKELGVDADAARAWFAANGSSLHGWGVEKKPLRDAA